MEAFAGFRHLLYHFRRKYFPKQRFQTQPLDMGLPEGIAADYLSAVCEDYFDEKAVSFTHQHLSGWKPSGAYRLLIKTRRGNEIRLIYKDAVYAHDQIPALVDLPVHPGPPEFVIYSQPTGPLAPYLPQVYLAKEVTPGVQYHYLLEDLGQDYHKIGVLEDVSRVSAMLPRLHQALSEWSAEIHPQGLLTYGKDFSQALQEYARVNLEKYSRHSEDKALKSVLDCWPQIAELHLLPEFFNLQRIDPIHGDTNYTNIHIHNHHPFQFKLVDWEWAGYGLPHADLASFVKGMPGDVEGPALRKFFGSPRDPNPCLNPELTFAENRRLHYWSLLERGLLDAAFLTVQHLNAPYLAKFSLPEAISRSLTQVLSVYHLLAN